MKNILKSFLLLAFGLSYGSGLPDIINTNIQNIVPNLECNKVNGLRLINLQMRNAIEELLRISLDYIESNLMGQDPAKTNRIFFRIKDKSNQLSIVSSVMPQNWVGSRCLERVPSIRGSSVKLCLYIAPDELKRTQDPLQFFTTTRYNEELRLSEVLYDLDEMNILGKVLEFMYLAQVLPRFDLKSEYTETYEFNLALDRLLSIMSKSIGSGLQEGNSITPSQCADAVSFMLDTCCPQHKVHVFNDTYKSLLVIKAHKKAILQLFDNFDKHLCSVTLNGHTAHLGIDLFKILTDLPESLKSKLPAGVFFEAVFNGQNQSNSAITSSEDLKKEILAAFVNGMKSHFASLQANE